MHHYSQHVLNRIQAYFWVAAASILLWFLVLSPAFDWPFSSASAIFIGLWILVDRFLWKLIPMRFFPNISGTYEGEVTFFEDGKRPSTTMNVEIEQTFTKMLIKAESDASTSRSRVAGLSLDGDKSYVLEYAYDNTFKTKAKTDASKTVGHSAIQDHLGYAILKFEKANPNVLEGQYFTEPPLNSSGKIKLTKIGSV